MSTTISRRRFLAASVVTAGAASVGWMSAQQPANDPAADRNRALISITLDLEMSRNFPRWDDTEWDYEKGNLNQETKDYTVRACQRVRERGGVIHCFALGRTLEQPDIRWLRDIARAGHPIGNHTYDHVNVRATRLEDVQFRFRRAPWLAAGRTPADLIRDNIRMTTQAMEARLEVAPSGFRTPGGFHDGLRDRADLRRMLRDLGFRWASSLYPNHPVGEAMRPPTDETIRRIVEAQTAAQPFAYEEGLIETPMSPISDIGAFRSGRWPLEGFLRVIRAAVEWTIERRATFDFLGHPSCLYVVDPQFRAIDLICDLVRQAGNRASIVDLGTIARRAGR